MIIGKKLICREQNLTKGEVTHIMGCSSLEGARAELARVQKKWEDLNGMSGALVIYGVAGDETSCYVFTPEDLLRYIGHEDKAAQAEQIYDALLEQVKLTYCEEDDESDYYSVLELYMDLGDLCED